jgi:geranylgeranyl diphosphate synthase type I
MDLARAAALIELSGARNWCQETADELFDEALRHLAAAQPCATAADELAGLARLATRRDH